MKAKLSLCHYDGPCYYGYNPPHYLTANACRRARIFDSDRLSQPADWPWSSWRFYYLKDSSLLSMDIIAWQGQE